MGVENAGARECLATVEAFIASVVALVNEFEVLLRMRNHNDPISNSEMRLMLVSLPAKLAFVCSFRVIVCGDR